MPIGSLLMALFLLAMAGFDQPGTLLLIALILAYALAVFFVSKKLRNIRLKNQEFGTYDTQAPVSFPVSELAAYSFSSTRAGMHLTLKSKEGIELRTIILSDREEEIRDFLAKTPALREF